MRAQVEFVSADFPPYPGEDQGPTPGRFGQRLAEFLAQELPAHGFPVLSVTVHMWGFKVALENPDYPLWLGCGNYEGHENGFLCFLEPATPFVGNCPTRQRLKDWPSPSKPSCNRAARCRTCAGGPKTNSCALPTELTRPRRQRHLPPTGSAVLSTTRRSTKLEWTPLTPLMPVMRLSSRS
jgi:hypothetical protein